VAGLSTGGQRFAGDDGKADPRVAAILEAYAAGREPERAALTALAGTRLLVPLIEREASERDVGSAREMAFPTLIGRDGRPALLAFTSLDALTRWRPGARPVPALAAQVWEMAVADSCAVVIDVTGPVPLAVDGARLGALAKGEPPPAPQDDPDVHAQIADALALAGEPAIAAAELSGGGEDTDLAVRLMIRPGATPPPDIQRAAEAIAARLAGRLRRGIEVRAVPAR